MARLPDEAVHQYQYVGLPDDTHIRILTLEPAPMITDDLICTIEAAPYCSAEYEALSYSWAKDDTGDAFETRQMYIEDKPLAITQNLFEGLRRLRGTIDSRRLWIDAVCINQNDIPERNAQVALMAKIYQNAECVPIWLGESGLESSEIACLHLLKRLELHTFRSFENQYSPGPFHRSCMLSSLSLGVFDCACTKRYPRYKSMTGFVMSGHPLDDERLDIIQRLRYLDTVFTTSPQRETTIWWNAFTCMEIFSRRYWTRRWIVQELHHAKHKILYWGPCIWELHEPLQNCSEPLSGVFQLLSMHLNKDLPMHPSDWADIERRCREVGRFLRVGVDTLSYDYWQKSRTHPPNFLDRVLDNVGKYEHEDHGISHWLAMCSRFQCQDPRDRVFALLSMSEPTLRADYNLDVQQTALMLTKHMIDSKQEVLWIQNLHRHHEARSIAFSDPSWQVDICGQFHGRTHHYGLPENVGRHEMSRMHEVQFQANSRREKTLGRFEIEDDALTCRARCFGEIGPSVDTTAGQFTLVLRDSMLQMDNLMQPPLLDMIFFGIEKLLPCMQRHLQIESQREHREHIQCKRNEGISDRYRNLSPGDLLCSLYVHPLGHDDIPVALLRPEPDSPGSHRIIDMFLGNEFRTLRDKALQDHNVYWTDCTVRIV